MDIEEELPKKGRPVGSKNKPKKVKRRTNEQIEKDEQNPKRGRGRPKGTKLPQTYLERRMRVDPLTGVKKRLCDTEDYFEERCQSVFDRNQSAELIDRLNNFEFDVIGELLTIYRTGDLRDRDKVEMLMKLMDYVYPKKKAIDITQHTETKVEYISTIVFEEPKKEVYASTE